MTEWQPIQTAPKNGSWVILSGGETDEHYYGDAGKPLWNKRRPVVAAWSAEDGEWVYDFVDGAWRSSYLNPTKWMPLPGDAQPTLWARLCLRFSRLF